MPFHVQFYTFTKRVNSTARPVGVELFPMEGDLKANSTIHDPDIAFVLPGNFQDVGRYNYAYIKLWQRFYYVRDWEWQAGVWIAHMREDPLASWRDEIGNLEEYILRSSQAFDGDIIDTFYPAKADVTRLANQIITGWATDINEDGSYVLGVVGAGANIGALQYLVLYESDFRILMINLMSDFILRSLPDRLEQTVSGMWGEQPIDYEMVLMDFKQYLKFNINPFQYIKSCMYFPFPISGSGGDTIKIGYWQSQAVGRPLENVSKFFSWNVPIPKHPLSGTRGNYLNMAPFTRYTLFAGQHGIIPLDSVSLSKVGSLDIDLNVDLMTGISQITVGVPSHTYNYIVTQREGQVGIPVTIAQVARDWLGATVQAISTVGNFASRGGKLDLGGAISELAVGIGNLTNSLMPQVMTSGSQGSICSLRNPYALEAECLGVADEDVEHIGRPLCQKRVINEVMKYMVIADADVSIPATDEEIREIKAYMEGGFYWE